MTALLKASLAQHMHDDASFALRWPPLSDKVRNLPHLNYVAICLTEDPSWHTYKQPRSSPRPPRTQKAITSAVETASAIKAKHTN